MEVTAIVIERMVFKVDSIKLSLFGGQQDYWIDVDEMRIRDATEVDRIDLHPQRFSAYVLSEAGPGPFYIDPLFFPPFLLVGESGRITNWNFSPMQLGLAIGDLGSFLTSVA